MYRARLLRSRRHARRRFADFRRRVLQPSTSTRKQRASFGASAESDDKRRCDEEAAAFAKAAAVDKRERRRRCRRRRLARRSLLLAAVAAATVACCSTIRPTIRHRHRRRRMRGVHVAHRRASPRSIELRSLGGDFLPMWRVFFGFVDARSLVLNTISETNICIV